jgi:crotonobetainyl-CoA:carnitine CoA-transferase CaiB-like acyl-CoA transferase
MPFRFASITERWSRRAAPLFGEHNREVLGGIVGLAESQIRALESANVIGSRPAGV